jgi:putative nucleotidyltransferase with HDIG domain
LSKAWAHEAGWTATYFAGLGALGAWLGHDLLGGHWMNLLYFAVPLVLLRHGSGVFLTRSEHYMASVENENSALFDKIGQLDRFNGDLVEALSMAIDSHSGCDAGKSRRIAQIAVSIGSALGISGTQLEVLRRGALLHDVGYLAIPTQILDKPGALSTREHNQMRLHCEFGARLVAKWRDCRAMAQIIEQHHEHYDGNGYPRGLKGDGIILEARIVAVADAYTSMVSDRPHRRALSHGEALAELAACAGTQFDPVVVEAMTHSVQYRTADVLPLCRSGR